MSGGSNTADDLPCARSATEALENAVEESRREYDKKVASMEEIDDKAMRSVRTAVILVGLVASAVSVIGPSAVSATGVIPVLVGALGVGALAVSIVYGIGLYSATEYPTGIDSRHRAEVIDGGYSRKEWFVQLLDEYDEWSDKIADELSGNLRYLELVQFSLALGVIALLTSASMIVLRLAYGIQHPITLSGIFVCLFVARTYLGDKG